MPQLKKLRVAWDRYWGHAMCFWEHVQSTFAGCGDVQQLQATLISMNAHEVVRQDLQSLRGAVSELREACEGAPMMAGLKGSARVMDALLLMISSSVACGVPSWRGVERLLLDGRLGQETSGPGLIRWDPADMFKDMSPPFPAAAFARGGVAVACQPGRGPQGGNHGGWPFATQAVDQGAYGGQAFGNVVPSVVPALPRKPYEMQSPPSTAIPSPRYSESEASSSRTLAPGSMVEVVAL